jgi:homoserine trans-succinylase
LGFFPRDNSGGLRPNQPRNNPKSEIQELGIRNQYATHVKLIFPEWIATGSVSLADIDERGARD